MIARAVLRLVSAALRSPSARSGRGAVGAVMEQRQSRAVNKEVREEAVVETDSDSKEELAVGSDYEVDEARASDHTVDSPRTKALQLEEMLVGLRENSSEGINRLRWLIDFGYNSSMIPDGRREKPKSKLNCLLGECVFWCLIVNVV